MNKKILFLCIFGLKMYAMDGGQNACTAFEPSTHKITTFDYEYDSCEFLELFKTHRETLVRRPEFDVNKMLFHDSVNYDDESTHGSLKIIVLRDLDAQSQMTLRAFAAYTVSSDKKIFKGELLAVKGEDRHKHYAEYLICHGIDQARAEGVTDMWLSTLRTNVPAQMVYKKVAEKYPPYELVQEPLNDKLKKLGLPENPRAEEAIAFTLKLKQS